MTFLSLKWFRWLLLLLIVETAGLIIWQRLGMNLVLPILGNGALK